MAIGIFAANVCRFPILEHWFLAGKFGARFSEMYIRPIFSTAISKKGRADGPTVAEAKGGIQVESHNDLIVGIFGGFFFLECETRGCCMNVSFEIFQFACSFLLDLSV